ncbi:hypothetical protein [Xanthobacter sp.]|uniref:hypothetical protein n=1 Tax=Xanthobacter sp. TaxID=35809 RepID=UPI0025F9586F|nr:hypothetical protein [Xanthobacter sp.]
MSDQKSDEPKLAELTKLKLEQREKLRAARLAISQIDSKMLAAGATLAQLGAICW